MRLLQSFPDIAIVYGVAPWVGWKESTVVGCVLFVYAHSPVPIVLAGKYFSRSAGRLRSTTRSEWSSEIDEKSELEKVEIMKILNFIKPPQNIPMMSPTS